jgi:hypothetical protein
MLRFKVGDKVKIVSLERENGSEPKEMHALIGQEAIIERIIIPGILGYTSGYRYNFKNWCWKEEDLEPATSDFESLPDNLKNAVAHIME